MRFWSSRSIGRQILQERGCCRYASTRLNHCSPTDICRLQNLQITLQLSLDGSQKNIAFSFIQHYIEIFLLMLHAVSTYHRRSKRRGEPNCSGHCRPSQARFHFGIVMCENGFRPPAAPYPIRVIFKLELSRADCTSHCHKILKSVGGHEIRPSFPMLKLLTFGTALGAAAAFSPFMVNFLSPFVPARFLQYFRDVLNLEILVME